jgi:hypothetical protein
METPKVYSKLRNEPNTYDQLIGFFPHIVQLIFDSSAKTILGGNDCLVSTNDCGN